MNVMKKFMNTIFVLVLVIGVVLGVGGCTKRDKNKSADSTQAVTTEATTMATTEAKNTKDNKSDNGKGKAKDAAKTKPETVKADATKTGKTENDSEKEPATQTPATTEAPTTQAPAPNTQAPAATEAPAPRAEEPTTAHQHTWKTVVDKEAWDEPIYEEQDVYEWHSMWPDGSYADELRDSCAKARWCGQHCTRCFPNCPDPDPAGRCALSVADGEVWVGTKKVQTGTRHHDAVTHQECSVCGARQ
ncbi:MAG: hypothetical protein MR799_02065 [Lachnospiraceae bacterium]|nr:hypothetical protein [Lachnospiraceae bacterium]